MSSNLGCADAGIVGHRQASRQGDDAVHEREGFENKLLESARNGDLKGMQKWLDAGADIHFHEDAAVGQAAMNGRIEALEFLKGRGANLHAVGDYALSVAATEGHPAAVRYLLNEGLSPHAVIPEAWSLIDSRKAQSPGRYDDVVSMLRDPKQVTASNAPLPAPEAVGGRLKPGVPEPTREKAVLREQVPHTSGTGLRRGVTLGGADVGDGRIKAKLNLDDVFKGSGAGRTPGPGVAAEGSADSRKPKAGP